MIPILYPTDEQEFKSNGIGRLRDAISCVVTEERNGQYELEMEYPVSGVHFADIAEERIILAAPSDDAREQPFRIYSVSKPLDGVTVISAHHISYDLKQSVVLPFSAENAAGAMAAIGENMSGGSGFEFWTDKETVASMKRAAPIECRSLLGGAEGSVLDVYGGEYEFDRFTVKLHEHRGADNGVKILYGKNMSGLTLKSDYSNVITSIVPYWQKEDTVVTGERVDSDHVGDYTGQKCVAMDFSQDYEDAPTAQTLEDAARAYMERNKTWEPSVSLDVQFIPLWQTDEYAHVAPLEHVHLCDTVTVENSALGVSAKAMVIHTEYDALTERYISLELGDAQTTLAEAVAKDFTTKEELQDATSFLESAVQRATDLICGGLGGYIVIKRNANGEPEELLIMDKPSIDEARNVWRWNMGGLGFSSAGYNGSYELAMTAEGQIVADFIATGTLNAANVKIINLVVDTVHSELENRTLDINGGYFYFSYNGTKRLEIYPSEIEIDTGSGSYTVESGAITISSGNVTDAGGLAPTDTGEVMRLTSRFLELGMKQDGTSDGQIRCSLINFGANGAPYISGIYDTGKPAGEYGARVIHLDGDVNATGELVISSGKAIRFEGANERIWASADSRLCVTGSTCFCKDDASNTPVMEITSSKVQLYETLDMGGYSITNQSDARIKENIKPTGVRALEVINGIDLKEYDFIEGGRHIPIGIIAQQLQTVAPDLVEEEEDGGLSVKVSDLIFYLIKAVQELSGKTPETWEDPYTVEEKQEFCGKRREKWAKAERQSLPTRPVQMTSGRRLA